ncbi:MAG TPA: agmatine deiminase family protein [Solirubrobacteraceae bacterium]
MTSRSAIDGLRMPAEWAEHERTLMAWPCREELWGPEIAHGRLEYAAVANAVAAFEPVSMVCGSPEDAAVARAALTAAAEVVELPIDDSWLRDSGPAFITGGGRRAGVHFGFNAWGGKFARFEHDAAVGGHLVERLGDERITAPFVLEGGAINVDGAGLLLTTEQCLLNPNRNPSLSREDIEAGLRDYLGVERIVWFERGLAEDRDTDGHVDMIAALTAPGELLLQSAPEGDPNHETMAANRAAAEAAGLRVTDMPLLHRTTVAGEDVALTYMNLYVCNGGVIVPQAGGPDDAEALERIAAAFPDREAVGVPALTIAYGGGGPHCITQQVPVAGA